MEEKKKKKKYVSNSFKLLSDGYRLSWLSQIPIGYYNSRFHDNEVRNPAAAEGYGYIPSFLW
jgi:hypothetical protein